MVTNSSIQTAAIGGTSPRAVAEAIVPEKANAASQVTSTQTSNAESGSTVVELGIAAQVYRRREQGGEENGGSNATQERTKRLAERLEQALNEAQGKRLRFNVLSRDTGLSEFNFQVIDSSTGQVVREFPPETIKALAENGKIDDAQGILVDKTA